jgi:uncharacterized membrane protein YjjB (DUF3815 family)
MLYPALQLLVPGSSGLHGLLLLHAGDYRQAGSVLGQATMRALALALGVLAAQLPQDALRGINRAAQRAWARRGWSQRWGADSQRS